MKYYPENKFEYKFNFKIYIIKVQSKNLMAFNFTSKA